jgi:hypothetical protein
VSIRRDFQQTGAAHCRFDGADRVLAYHRRRDCPAVPKLIYWTLGHQYISTVGCNDRITGAFRNPDLSRDC